LEIATIPKSTTLAKPGEPARTDKDFRLFARATGRWAKKVCENLPYFGPSPEPQKGFDEWLDKKDAREHCLQVTDDYFELVENPEEQAP
jgi:hypothetical protein